MSQDIFGELGDLLVPLIGWLLDGAELILIRFLPMPWNMIAQLAIDILQQMMADMGAPVPQS